MATLKTVKGLCQFVKIIPYIIWRKILKLFNKKKINGTKEVSHYYGGQSENRIAVFQRVFVATFLTL